MTRTYCTTTTSATNIITKHITVPRKELHYYSAPIDINTNNVYILQSRPVNRRPVYSRIPLIVAKSAGHFIWLAFVACTPDCRGFRDPVNRRIGLYNPKPQHQQISGAELI